MNVYKFVHIAKFADQSSWKVEPVMAGKDPNVGIANASLKEVACDQTTESSKK